LVRYLPLFPQQTFSLCFQLSDWRSVLTDIRWYISADNGANVQQAWLRACEQFAGRDWHAAYGCAVDTGVLWPADQGEE
jgi:hypothetical protein